MKKYIPQIAVILILVTILTGVPADMAHAVEGTPSFATNVANKLLGTIIDVTFGGILQIVGSITYVFLALAAAGLTLASTALNLSLFLTTHLVIFINNTPTIYQVWTILRDLAGMFLIFMLLYAAFLTILDMKGPNYKEVLLNIVIIGIFINFSFFFATVAIDASNIVSLQLYNAMAPNISAVECGNLPPGTYLTCISQKIVGSNAAGLATVITDSLDTAKWWKFSSDKKFSLIDISTQMIIINSAAIAVIVLTILSFLAAAAATIWRTCVLIILLAFSPLWIVGRILPQVKSAVSDKWMKHFKANLIFLPVYLLLMYVVIRIITSLNLAQLGTSNSGLWYASYFQLFAGFAIILFLINMPLGIALSVSGATGTFTETIAKKVRGTVGGWLGTNTLGRAGSLLDKRLANTPRGNSASGRVLRSMTTTKLATGKYGGTRTYADVEKEKKDVLKHAKEIGRRRELNDFLKNGGTTEEYRERISQMSGAEKLELGAKFLGTKEVAMHLKKSDFDAIKQSDMKKEEKDAIDKARTDAFTAALSANEGRGDNKSIKNMIKNFETDDLLKYINSTYSGARREEDIPDSLVTNLTRGNLEAMGKEDLNSNIKKLIGKKIYAWDSDPDNHRGIHPADGFVRKNGREWTGLDIH